MFKWINWIFTNSNSFIEYAIVSIVILSLIYLTILSVMNKDVAYPSAHPYYFTLETLLFSIGTGVIVFLMAYGRNNLGISTLYQFIILTLKFGLLHILLQFSGFYSYVFNYKSSKQMFSNSPIDYKKYKYIVK